MSLAGLFFFCVFVSHSSQRFLCQFVSDALYSSSLVRRARKCPHTLLREAHLLHTHTRIHVITESMMYMPLNSLSLSITVSSFLTYTQMWSYLTTTRHKRERKWEEGKECNSCVTHSVGTGSQMYWPDFLLSLSISVDRDGWHRMGVRRGGKE